MILSAEGIARADILESYTRTYIASADEINGVLVVGVHLEDTRYTLFLARTRIVYIRTGLQFTGVNSEVAQTSYIRVSSNLECQCCERLGIVGLARSNLFVARVCTFDNWCIHRRRQVRTYGVKHRLHTFVLERRTANNGEDVHAYATLADSGTNLVLGDSSGIREVLLHQHVVELGTCLQHLVTPLLSLGNQVGRYILYGILCAHRLVVPKNGFHFNQINYTLERLLCSDRNLDWARLCTKHFLDLANNVKEVRTRTVHLVDVADTRYAVLVSLTPYGFRLRLYATYCAERSHSTVKDTKRTLYLDREVHVPRSVNQVDLVFVASIVPVSSGSCRRDRYTTLLLLLHPVHGGSTIVHLADLVGQTRVEQDALRRSCLTGIDVSHNADIAV